MPHLPTVFEVKLQKQGFMSCSELLGHLSSSLKKIEVYFFSRFIFKVLSSIKPVTDIQSRVPNNNNNSNNNQITLSVAHLQNRTKPSFFFLLLTCYMTQTANHAFFELHM